MSSLNEKKPHHYSRGANSSGPKRSNRFSAESGTVQGKDRATCDGQPRSLCVLLGGNQKLSVSAAPPGQQGGAVRNIQRDPSLSCYSRAFRCCQLPVTNASRSACGVTNQLLRAHDGRIGITFGGCRHGDHTASVPAMLMGQEWAVRDLWEDGAWYNSKLSTRESEEHCVKCRNLSHCRKRRQALV